jgi:GPH family glycoside/pentoside/hexuronide:cation symporter
MSKPVISTKALVQYGLIALPVAFAGFPLYVLAPDFYATHYGLSLTLLGTLLLAIRLFDAVQDPIIGWIIDKLHGNFLPLAMTSAAILCLSVFGLFNKMYVSAPFWFGFSMVLAVSAYSFLTVLLGSLATLWTSEPHDQTRIAGMREAFGLIGLVTAVSMPALFKRFVTEDQVYIWYCAVLAILMIIGLYGFAATSAKVRTANLLRKSPEKVLLSNLLSLPHGMLRLLVVYGISMLGSSVPAVLVIFYVRDLLGAEHLTGIFLLLYFLSGAFAMPIWKKLSLRFGKHKTWFLSSLVAVFGFSGALFLEAGDIIPFGFICVVSGLALGADLSLPPSILADQIHARGKQNYSGTYYASMAFVTKLSLALASALVLPGLDLAGFKPKAANSDQALLALSIAYAFVPFILKLTAAGLLYTLFIRSNTGGNHATLQNGGNYGSSHHA